jgi:hypothetical protein
VKGTPDLTVLSRIVDNWHAAHVLPRGQATERLLPNRALPRVRQVAELVAPLPGGSARTIVCLQAQLLAGRRRRVRRRKAIRVLFEQRGEGLSGRLEMEILPDGPSGLFPDPRTMGMVTADPVFEDAITDAWTYVTGRRETRACVIWRLTIDGPWSLRIQGGSLGAAFAVLLSEVIGPPGTRFLSSRPFGILRSAGRWLRVRRDRMAITGRAGVDGVLGAVGSLKAKLERAKALKLSVVAPAANQRADQQFADGVTVRWVPNVKTAHRELYRIDRLRSSILATSMVAVLAATGFGLYVTQVRDKRHAQAIATARRAAALAEANLSTNLDLSQLLAVGAYQLHADSQTEAALFQAVTAGRHLVRYLQVGSPIVSLGSSADGRVIVAGTVNGELAWFNTTTGAHDIIRTDIGTVSQVAVDVTGAVVTASGSHDAVIWNDRSKSLKKASVHNGKIVAIALSPLGDFSAILYTMHPDANLAFVTVRNNQTGREVRSQVEGPNGWISFAPRRKVMVNGPCGYWQSLKLPNLTRGSRGGKSLCPATNYISGSSPDGRVSGYAAYGSVTAWNSWNTEHLFSANHLTTPVAAMFVAFSNDGKRAAIVQGGNIFVAPLEPYGQNSDASSSVTELSSNSNTTLAVFMGNNRMASATDRAVSLWNLSSLSRIGNYAGVSVPWAGMYGLPPQLSISPNGNVLVLQGGYGGAKIYRIGGGLTNPRKLGSVSTGSFFAWHGDQPLFIDWTGGQIEITNSAGRVLRRTHAAVGRESYISTVRSARNGTEAVFVDQAANIWTLDLNNGRTSHIVAAPGSTALSPQDVAVSEDGRYAIMSDRGHKRVVSVDLDSGAVHTVGTGEAEGVLYVNGKTFIQRDSGPLQVWDERGSHLLRSLPSIRGHASAMSASADGTRIARLADNGAVSIASVTTGDLFGTFTLPFPPEGGGSPDPWSATTIQFMPNGRTLYAATTGGQLTRWITYAPDLLKIACATVGRSMTAEEWRALVSNNPPARLPCKDGS